MFPMRKKITLQAAPFQRIWNVMLDEAAYHYLWVLNVFFFGFSESISRKNIPKTKQTPLKPLHFTAFKRASPSP